MEYSRQEIDQEDMKQQNDKGKESDQIWDTKICRKWRCKIITPNSMALDDDV